MPDAAPVMTAVRPLIVLRVLMHSPRVLDV
jgi:hypothetical protein